MIPAHEQPGPRTSSAVPASQALLSALPPLLRCDAACYQGGYDCARVLLEKGRADVHATGKDCRSTPLQFAALSGNMDLVKLMLKYQVSPHTHKYKHRADGTRKVTNHQPDAHGYNQRALCAGRACAHIFLYMHVSTC